MCKGSLLRGLNFFVVFTVIRWELFAIWQLSMKNAPRLVVLNKSISLKGCSSIIGPPAVSQIFTFCRCVVNHTVVDGGKKSTLTYCNYASCDEFQTHLSLWYYIEIITSVLIPLPKFWWKFKRINSFFIGVTFHVKIMIIFKILIYCKCKYLAEYQNVLHIWAYST